MAEEPKHVTGPGRGAAAQVPQIRLDEEHVPVDPCPVDDCRVKGTLQESPAEAIREAGYVVCLIADEGEIPIQHTRQKITVPEQVGAGQVSMNEYRHSRGCHSHRNLDTGRDQIGFWRGQLRQ